MIYNFLSSYDLSAGELIHKNCAFQNAQPDIYKKYKVGVQFNFRCGSSDLTCFHTENGECINIVIEQTKKYFSKYQKQDLYEIHLWGKKYRRFNNSTGLPWHYCMHFKNQKTQEIFSILGRECFSPL